MLSYPFNAAAGLCAGAAQAAPLCFLVIRGAQRGLAKGCLVYRGGRARLVHRIKCGRWASLPAEGLRTIPRLRDTWRLRTPTLCGRPDGRRRSRTPMGVRALAVGTELPLFRDTWRPRTLPQAGSGSGAVGQVRGEPDRWGLATPPFPRSYGQLRGSCLAAVRVGIPVTGYRQWPPGPPWVRYEPTGGATFAIWLHSVSAGALTGFDLLSGWLLPHHIATAY